MTYLAEVVQAQRLGQKARAKLLGVKRSDGLWIGVKQTTRELPYSKVWNEKQLVLLELDKEGRVEEVIPGSDRLFEVLREWSLRLTRFDSDKADLELKKQSLEYQAAKLFARDQELRKREELQRHQEEKLESILKLAQDKLDAAAKQHEALKGAWEHLNYKEQQLKKG